MHVYTYVHIQIYVQFCDTFISGVVGLHLDEASDVIV